MGAAMDDNEKLNAAVFALCHDLDLGPRSEVRAILALVLEIRELRLTLRDALQDLGAVTSGTHH